MTTNDSVTAEVPTMEVVVGPEVQHEIEQFLYFEARLLDDRRYDDWLKILADDIHYWMPTRYNRLRREADLEFSGPSEVATFDEDKRSMASRVYRLGTGFAWAEDPPSRTRHIVSNVWISLIDGDEYSVQSSFVLYRNRGEVEWDLWAGRRDDILRRVGPHAFQIAKRLIILDQSTIMSRNLSVFF